MKKIILSDLATKINEQHNHVLASAKTSIEHARNAGELLTLVKDVQRGSFQAWIEANCKFSLRTAQVYMRIADNWTALEGRLSAPEANLSIDGAMKLLSKPKTKPATALPNERPAEPELNLSIETARALREVMRRHKLHCPITTLCALLQDIGVDPEKVFKPKKK